MNYYKSRSNRGHNYYRTKYKLVSSDSDNLSGSNSNDSNNSYSGGSKNSYNSSPSSSHSKSLSSSSSTPYSRSVSESDWAYRKKCRVNIKKKFKAISKKNIKFYIFWLMGK